MAHLEIESAGARAKVGSAHRLRGEYRSDFTETRPAPERATGAARGTTGAIATHDISHDANQSHRKWPVAEDGRLAIPAATKGVNPLDLKNEMASGAG